MVMKVGDMEIRVKGLTQETFKEVPYPCKVCLYWRAPKDFDRDLPDDLLEAEKERWLFGIWTNFGECGKIAYWNDVPIGFACYAPAHFFPQIRAYEAKPYHRIEEDIIFICCLYIIEEELQRKGIGRGLLRLILEDLKGRGYRFVETFARRGSSINPSGPLEFYLSAGFRIVNEVNPEFPLVRLDLLEELGGESEASPLL